MSGQQFVSCVVKHYEVVVDDRLELDEKRFYDILEQDLAV
jgi:hypothetical protein